MTRVLPDSVQDMADVRTFTLARGLKVVLRDGAELGWTDHDKPLTVALANDAYEPVEYQPGGIIMGDLDLSCSLEADNIEIRLPIDDTVTRAATLARRFSHADAYLFDCDWTQDVPEATPLLKGQIAEARVERSMAVFQIRGLSDYWNVVVGRLLSPRCSADFGDAQCGATPENRAVSVLQAISNMRFLIDIAENLADDFFRFGEVEFLTGDLGSTWPYEVVAFDGYTGEVEVLSPMPGMPEAGDQLLIRNGCSRLKRSDDASIPTCATYNNVRRFRGFDRVPGSDRFLQVPTPGGA